MNKEQLLKQKEEIEKQLKEIELQEEYIEVPELGIKITKCQKFNNKSYEEILKEVDESKIATYEILQKLRNIAFKSNWKKYSFMKNFWVWVPNNDEASKLKGNVSRFGADPDGAVLGSDRGPSGGVPDIGVFLYCPTTASLKILKLEKEKKR